VELLLIVLERLSRTVDSRTRPLLPQVLAFIHVSRHGISEHELVAALGCTRADVSALLHSLQVRGGCMTRPITCLLGSHPIPIPSPDPHRNPCPTPAFYFRALRVCCRGISP